MVDRATAQRRDDAAVRGRGPPARRSRQAIAETLRDVTKLRGEVELVAPGSLPNDGKVIEDVRKYE